MHGVLEHAAPRACVHTRLQLTRACVWLPPPLLEQPIWFPLNHMWTGWTEDSRSRYLAGDDAAYIPSSIYLGLAGMDAPHHNKWAPEPITLINGLQRIAMLISAAHHNKWAPETDPRPLWPSLAFSDRPSPSLTLPCPL